MASDNNKSKRTGNFRLSVVDAQSHERLWSFSFSRPGFVAAVAGGAVVLLVGFFSLIAFTPVRTFIPGYPDARSKRMAVQNAMRIDSLETCILQWELYTENLRKVLAGEAPLRLDSLILRQRQADSLVRDARWLASRDSLLRARVDQEEQFEVQGTRRDLPIEAMSFFSPLKGVVSQPFEPELHPYVDVTAPANSVVMAVLDGTVVYADWDDETGYSVVLQHPDDLLSVYRRNERLLHKPGEQVKAGTPLATVASTSGGDSHLHFELWYKGAAVDPVRYIGF